MTFIRSIPRVLALALLGAAAGAALLAWTYSREPGVVFDLDRDLPPNATGFYGIESTPQYRWVWTMSRADLELPGLNRRSSWRCVVRLRGARPAPVPQPTVEFAVDGVSTTVYHSGNQFRDVEVPVPARPSKPGLLLSISSSPTFVPGSADRRALGVQVERLGCWPAEERGWVVPPARVLRNAAIAAGVFGLLFALSGIPFVWAVGGTSFLAAAQTFPLTTGGAVYGPYSGELARLAVWIALLTIGALALLGPARRRPLSHAGSFVVLFSATALYLKLLGLEHPSKALVDAVFHAHRFEAVLAGRLYFTQLSTSATPFPYAIGLYLFAAPWAFLTRDHVTLLRIVVVAAEVVAGALLYVMVVRAWGDRIVGAVAVALSQLVPISYAVLGNANLTNAFGSAAALATVAATTIWAAGRRRAIGTFGLVVLATLALISHVSIVSLLLPTLVVLATLYRLMDRSGAARSRALLAVTFVATICAIVLYYGHFGEVYRAGFARMRAAAIAGPASQPSSVRATAPAAAKPGERPRLGKEAIPLPLRASDAVAQTIDNLGWPILLFAGIGAWHLWRVRARDALASAVLAWMAVMVAGVTLSVVTAVDMKYQQDAWEFIGRVEQMASPGAVLLAAAGAGWMWRAGRAGRVVAVALLVAAVFPAARAWRGWIS